MEQKTLLIFDSFGQDNLRFYVLDDAPKWLESCHEKYVNAVESEEVAEFLTRITDAICETPSHYSNPKDEIAGTWVSKRVKNHLPPNAYRLVITGFIP